MTARDASERLSKLRKKIEGQPNSDPGKEAALLALNVAEATRQDRNEAGHEAEAPLETMKVNELLSVGTLVFGKLVTYGPT